MDVHHLLYDLLIAIAVLDVLVSLGVALHRGYTVRQKIMQIILVWLLPVLSGVVFGLFLITQRETFRPMPRNEESDVSRQIAHMAMQYRPNGP